MDIGVTIRNMGEQSTAAVMLACAQAAETARLESVWITDHIAIPPDDAEGSGGRYLDTLTTLAWLAGHTQQVKLASGVLVLPYRPLLPTAKQIATLQELSGERLILGVGVGWMDAEFRALGVDRHQRGAITDQTLAFLQQCFADDEVSLNGQTLLFRPRPAKPTILVGGRAPHALQRAVRYADGWLPMARRPEQIAADVEEYRRLCAAAGRAPGDVTVMTALPLDDAPACRDFLAQYRDMQVNRLVCAVNYDSVEQYQAQIAQLKSYTA